MPDPNNPLETALRNIRTIFSTGRHIDLGEKEMVLIRAELINFRNLETAKVIGMAAASRDYGEQ